MRNFCASASYRISELKVLNELDYPVWISTYQPEDTHFLWANDAALCLWKAPTLEAFVSTDLVSKRSAAVATIHDELFNDVQASNEKCPQPRAASPRQSPYPNAQVHMRTVRCRRTLYPGGSAATLDLTFKPINVFESDGSEPKTRAIVFAVPVHAKVQNMELVRRDCE